MAARRRQGYKDTPEDQKKLLNYEKTLIETLHIEEHETTDIRGDKCNIGILFFLYVLQGIPLGLIAAIPMLLQNRGASYKQQAEFSFACWPFSMKLLWAPIVDALYIKKFGRRKSWLVPTQYLIGGFMLFLSWHVERWLGGNGADPNVPLLTLVFFILNFLAATQDIAVDGWALTMLKRCNVGYASTCNSVGQTAGYFLGYVAFIALESKEFCNTYLRTIPKDEGMVTLPEFLWFWGICFLVATTLVAILKKENDVKDEHTEARYTDVHELNIQESYKILWDMVRMRPVIILAAILLTVKVTFAASDAVTSLKLIDAGVPKDKLALLVIPIVPLQIILPLVVSRYTNGPRPMDVYLKAIPYRIIFSTVAAVITYLTPYMITKEHVPIYYYVLLVANYGVYQIFLYCMFVAVMAFFAKISDPAVGGTYMTFLNTLSNLGGNWPNTVILWLVDVLTWKECVTVDTKLRERNHCLTKQQKQECSKAGGECRILFDGYYIECILCCIYGIIWLFIARKWITYLQNLPTREWAVVKTSKKLNRKKFS
ncbi:acetyl-coenzyme A transporter 1 [Teleopsis dalmanni]|uniref:acetyl-coenzyme A transporter 1 n=1 Tax=Teleopsis dalmanni TaxID=139649 RepID=UPI0018CF27B9|nr:acetyl-coenzyme A transporter 1 [Teleopsis dalmanni]